MKQQKFLNILLSFILLSTSIANANPSVQEPESAAIFCEDAYLDKLERIEKNRTWRTIGKGAFMVGAVGGTVATGMAIFGVGNYLFATILVAGLVPPYLVGAVSLNLYENVIDREQLLIGAIEALMIAQVDPEVLKKEHHAYLVKIAVDKQNKERNVVGLPPLTTEEIDIIAKKIPYGDISLNWIHVIQQNLSKKYSYDEIRNELLKHSKTDAFCPPRKNGKLKPITIRKMTHILEGELK